MSPEDQHLKMHAEYMTHCERKPRFRWWRYLNQDHIDDHANNWGLKFPDRYLPGSAIWHDRLAAECYFIAGDCI